MANGLTLICPVRGKLTARGRSVDGLRPTEEKFRVEAIRHLLDRDYPVANFKIEAVVKRFGNSGRNSLRADFAVLDVPASTIPSGNVDQLLAHALVLGEVKRDNVDAKAAKSFQVRPMLDFAQRDDCVALYWDNVEQRVYWYTRTRGQRVLHEGSLVTLPGYGEAPAAKHLTFATLDADKSLLDVFRRVEDIFHTASVGPQKRYGVILQLLLAKLYDEHHHMEQPDKPLDLQDFAAIGVDAVIASERFHRLLVSAVRYYRSFLPEHVEETLPISADVLVEVLRVLAPVKIVAMRQSVIQDFYMYFAKHLYRWDMAQYFTPTSLTSFIIDILNPVFGEHIRDPACGSADFLTAAFRRGTHFPDYASSVWGSDNAAEAVQVAVLNMILNGDGKTNIKKEDSLVQVDGNAESSEIVVCNPPFGTKIVERRKSVLSNFDLGHEGRQANGELALQPTVLNQQETGILFAELCVRLVRPGGRIGLIVPNGYLGNTSVKYQALREWLLCHCRLAAIVAFPRFTFKGSGADVSASVIFLEKRSVPLAKPQDDTDYEVAIEVVNRVGWNVGVKRGEVLYRRDPSDGSYLVDGDDQLIVDSDFPQTLAALRASDAVQYFPWLGDGVATDGPRGWTVPADMITNDPWCTCDPKRLGRKVQALRQAILGGPHFRLGDVLQPIAEKTTSAGKAVRFKRSDIYGYVDITNTEAGSYRWKNLRGWQLPARAKHLAETGDLYLGSVWGSVRKWLFVGSDTSKLVVTNGFIRTRLMEGKEDFLVDLIAGLCTEVYTTQMRAFARGSDGLAQVLTEDAMDVVLPRITDRKIRAELVPFAEQLRAGYTSAEVKVRALATHGTLPLPAVPHRPDHFAVV